MSENGKTLTFVGVALALVVVSVLARPKVEAPAVSLRIGKPLFEKFTDANKAASLKIVKYAEDLGEVTSFEVAKSNTGLWTIPSHGNYPADAETQMKDAATSLIGLTVLGLASENPSDHMLYGVVEPDKEKLKVGDKGVGLLVAFADELGTNLGSLIIGKEVKGTTDQRFVRRPRQDQVFVVKISPTKLSTKFEDWIEKDLLKISTMDVERLRLKDHSVVQTAQGFVAQPRAEIAVSLDSSGSQWKLDEMIVHREGGPKKTELLPGEELNKEKLDALKNALSEVKIADVFQKPKGLDASLKSSGDFLNDREAQRSLAERGFVLSRDNEVWSANGELRVGLKDGVDYFLRFGNVAGEQQDSKEGKLNRYLFVMAKVNESKFPAPTLEDLPSDAVPAAPAAPAAGDKPAGTGDCGEAQEKSGEASDKKADPAPAADQKKDAAETAKESPAPAAKPAAEEPAAKAEGEKKDAAAPTADKKPEAPQNEDEVKRKKIEAERERITKENQRKIDKWKDDKGKAEAKVRELNARFAPWYYVISEDVYKKIHLSRSDIIKEGAKSAEEGTGLDAFRKLEKEGINKPAQTTAPPSSFPPGGFPPGGFPPAP